jgi:PAS domain S-box-containing protein
MKNINKSTKQLLQRIVGQGIIEAINDGVIIQDTNFKMLYQNKQAVAMLGDNVGNECFRAFTQEDHLCNGCPLSRSFVDGNVHTTVMKHKRGQKEYTYEVTSSPIRNTAGKVVAGIEVVRDVTVPALPGRKHVSGGGNAWEEAFDIINDAITIHDRDFNIIRANKAAEELLGMSSAEILKKRCFEFYHGSASPPKNCPSCQTLKTGLPTTAETYESSLNKYIQIKAFPRFDKDRSLIGMVHVVSDITKRKKLEKERENLIFVLTDALFKVNTLSGLLPICASCKKIRDDNGYWKQVDDYIREHSNAEFTHGICPECAEKEFPDSARDIDRQRKSNN